MNAPLLSLIVAFVASAQTKHISGTWVTKMATPTEFFGEMQMRAIEGKLVGNELQIIPAMPQRPPVIARRGTPTPTFRASSAELKRLAKVDLPALKDVPRAHSQRDGVAGGYAAKIASHGVVMLQVSAATVAQPEVWKFDRLDNIGGHATTIDGKPRVIDTPGGKAIQFDGVGDALFVDSHPLAGADAFTWEVIFRPDKEGSPEQRFFHLQERDAKTGADTATRLLFETRLVGDQWYLDSFALSGGASQALMNREKLHPLGEWYHVAMVYDGKEFRNYVNGVLEGSAQLRLMPQGAGHSSVGVRINRKDYFKGAIQVTRMSRTALEPRDFLKRP